jgi:hypothetical protein
MGWGSRIRDPEKLIPDPGGQKSTVSRIRNIEKTTKKFFLCSVVERCSSDTSKMLVCCTAGPGSIPVPEPHWRSSSEPAAMNKKC